MPPEPARRGRRPYIELLEDRCLLDSSGLVSLDSLSIDQNQYRLDRILVQFREGQEFQAGGARLGASLGSVQEVVLPKDLSMKAALGLYQADPRVLFAQPDYVVSISATTPNDPYFGSLWGLNNTGQSGGSSDADIDAPAAWSVTVGSGQTIVAVIDTGIDYNHPDLAANIWTNPGEIPGNRIDDDGNGWVDDIHGYDFANNDGNPMDDNGHGTHVAGTIGAVGDNGRGVVGVNWNVQLMALKFLNASGSGYTSDALRALNYAVANGATISNNSWGGGGIDPAMLTAIRNARSAGHIFVAAAGNNSRNNDTSPSYPANYDVDNVVSVAALDRFDNLASFSNYGANTVDLGAPGVSILSTTPNNTYSTYSGTSMATPHVTGVIALVRDLHPNWTYRQVIDQVLSTVTPVASLNNRTVTGGRVNAAAAAGAGIGDTTAPRILEAVPNLNLDGSVGSLRVTFSKAIDPTTFSAADITEFAGPNGPISVFSVVAVPGSGNRQFDVNFGIQSAAGDYTLLLGPDIRDAAGNRLNQDGDGVFGEMGQDQLAVSFTVRPAFGFASADVNKPIYDFQRTVSYIDVTQAMNVKDVNVQVSVLHSYDGDLKICLVSPNGKKIPLAKRRGGGGDDFTTTVFDDQAATPISAGAAPFAGSYRPEKALTAFKGQQARGRWQLWIDDLAYGDYGWLSSWSLAITPKVAVTRPQAAASQATRPLAVERSLDEMAMLLVRAAKKDASRHLFPVGAPDHTWT